MKREGAEPSLHLTKGDHCWLVVDRYPFPAQVILASPNSHSLALDLHQVPFVFLGLSALLWSPEDGCYHSILSPLTRAVFVRPPGPLETCDVIPGRGAFWSFH